MKALTLALIGFATTYALGLLIHIARHLLQ